MIVVIFVLLSGNYLFGILLDNLYKSCVACYVVCYVEIFCVFFDISARTGSVEYLAVTEDLLTF